MDEGSKDPLVWIDCEMTGLDVEKDEIMSICCFITDANLALLDEKGYESVVHHDKPRLDQMDSWCLETHGKSGLLDACISSKTTHDDAATGLLDYVKRFAPAQRSALLAGNSVHVDQRFLLKPPYDKVIHHLQYRILDISSIKEAARRWASEDILGRRPSKRGLHQAREDILESIEEARYYRDVFFTPAKVIDKDSESPS